jgi:hypothetical protein
MAETVDLQVAAAEALDFASSTDNVVINFFVVDYEMSDIL